MRAEWGAEAKHTVYCLLWLYCMMDGTLRYSTRTCTWYWSQCMWICFYVQSGDMVGIICSFGISVIALYLYQWVSFIYQVIHFTLTVQTTDISWFPFITTIYIVTLEQLSHAVFSPTSHSVHSKPSDSNHIQKQFTMTHSGTSHSISHLEPRCFLLSGSILYHSNTTQTHPIDTAWSLV